METVLYVGIDTSLDDHDVCAMEADSHIVARTKVPKGRDSAEPLVAWLSAQAAPYTIRAARRGRRRNVGAP